MIVRPASCNRRGLIFVLVLAALAAWQSPRGSLAEPPRVLDERLVLELFAEAPDIVTPTGIAVEPSGRVLVIESHTHFRPEGYQGPATDRIRAFEDRDGDGRAEVISTLFEGTRSTMNLGVLPDGGIYVATRNRVFRLNDPAMVGGQIGEPKTLVSLITDGDYPHNGLSGFAFDFVGNVYFGLGENLGADYQLQGSDGTVLTGGGEGGSIFRCNAAGGELRRVATGFWNPFHVCLDPLGRLYAVDNDPDSRPPCRLLHIVQGGDYGYRFRNGRKGLHPFTAWNGELPGTLPMLAGTGEAPSGIISYDANHLPSEYRGALLGTSWGDHQLERFRPRTQGASFTAKAEPFVSGGEDFRPVGIAVGPDGSLYISDWVDKSYELHGQGRVWRIRARVPGGAVDPNHRKLGALLAPDRAIRERAARWALAEGGPEGRAELVRIANGKYRTAVRATALVALASVNDTQDVEVGSADERLLELALSLLPAAQLEPHLKRAAQVPALRAGLLRRPTELPHDLAAGWVQADLASPDPFLRQAAQQALGDVISPKTLASWASGSDPALRLAMVLHFRQVAESADHAHLVDFLKDADPRVQFAAVQWVGEGRLTNYSEEIEQLLAADVSRELFEACLATLERLGPARGDAAPTQEGLEEDYVAALLLRPDLAARVRSRAARMLRADHPVLTPELLASWLATDDAPLRVEVVRKLAERTDDAAWTQLVALVEDESQPRAVRGEAIAGLARDAARIRRLLVKLARAGDDLADDACRALVGLQLSPAEQQVLTKVELADRELQERLVGTFPPPRPALDDITAWAEALAGPADPQRGEMVFFHPKGPGCGKCHAVEGRGGRAGPDLSNARRSLSRQRLLESILVPSREVAPQFVTWNLVKRDGTVLTAVELGQGHGGEQLYGTAQGEVLSLHPTDIETKSPQKLSLMPDKLTDLMTLTDFRDLLAWLSSE